jgi:hypothetical protein
MRFALPSALLVLGLVLHAAPLSAAPLTLTSHAGSVSTIARFDADPTATTLSDLVASPLDPLISASLSHSAGGAGSSTLSMAGSAALTETARRSTVDFSVGMDWTLGSPSDRVLGGVLVNSTWDFTMNSGHIVLTYDVTEAAVGGFDIDQILVQVVNVTTGTTFLNLAAPGTTVPTVVDVFGTAGDTLRLQYAGIAQDNLIGSSAPDISYLNQSSFAFDAGPESALPAPSMALILAAGFTGTALRLARGRRA